MENIIGKTLYFRTIGNSIIIVTVKGFELAGDNYQSDSYYGNKSCLYPNEEKPNAPFKMEWSCNKEAFEKDLLNGKYNHLIDEDTLNLLPELQFKRGGRVSNEQITQVKDLLKISGDEDPRVLTHLRNMIVFFFAEKMKETPDISMELMNILSAVVAVIDNIYFK